MSSSSLLETVCIIAAGACSQPHPTGTSAGNEISSIRESNPIHSLKTGIKCNPPLELLPAGGNHHVHVASYVPLGQSIFETVGGVQRIACSLTSALKIALCEGHGLTRSLGSPCTCLALPGWGRSARSPGQMGLSLSAEHPESC